MVRQFPAHGRRALYAAANAGSLRRGSWEGCALNRAGAAVGLNVRSRGEAAYAFGITPETARQFVEVWDRLWGSNRRCTQMLREAIEQAGLFEDEPSLTDPMTGKITVS
ncbi:MAG: hypothetical protein M3357_00855 [Actinomycetota bacterium]|nr:hypothetical protein [Actinomycetota bacterium]